MISGWKMFLKIVDAHIPLKKGRKSPIDSYRDLGVLMSTGNYYCNKAKESGIAWKQTIEKSVGM